MKIIKCNNGNIMGVLKEVSDVSDKILSANSVDASFEKHIPNYEIIGDEVKLYVSHVMEEDHYIEWIMADYGDKEIIKHLKPHEEPMVVVPYQEGMKAYSYCNKHSLWLKDKIER